MKCHGFMGSWTSTSSPRNVARCCPCHLSTLPICICNSSASRLAQGYRKYGFSMEFIMFWVKNSMPCEPAELDFLVLNLPQILTPFRGWFSALKRDFFSAPSSILPPKSSEIGVVSCSVPTLVGPQLALGQVIGCLGCLKNSGWKHITNGQSICGVPALQE